MPATLHIASRMASQRFVILDQSEAQDLNGLVTVSVTYGVDPLLASDLSRVFYLDAPPPVFPTCTQRSTLQGAQGLYLLEHAVEKRVGLWTIRATYVGARVFISGRSAYITRDSESRVTPTIKLLAGYDLTAETPPRQIAQYDIAVVRFIAQVITIEYAGVGSGYFDLEGREQSADGLIYRIEYGSFEHSNPDVRTRFSRPSPNQLLRSFNPYVEVSTSIRNVTNLVIVAVTTRNVVFDPLALVEAVNQ